MLFPIRDENPSREKPIVNYVIIGINILVYLYEVSLDPTRLHMFFMKYGIIPIEYGIKLGIVHSVPPQYIYTLNLVRSAVPWNLLTAMFLHGGFMHILGNMWFLWIFGDNVEDAMGHFRYLIFYILSGLIASFTHILFHPGSAVPMIGASGAISGVLGAYFLLYPGARIISLAFLGFVITTIALPAYLYLGVWIFIQIIFGFGSIGAHGAASGVAWFAHIGGFFGGMLIMPLFARRRRTPPRYYWW